MAVLSDKWIKKASLKGMIKPFVDKQVRKGKISLKITMKLAQFYGISILSKRES